MKVEKVYMTKEAKELVNKDNLFKQSYDEVVASICSAVWPMKSKTFKINNSQKNGNGVVPVKELCYSMLEDTYNWYREKPLNVLKLEKKKGGPIDVYKEFTENFDIKRVGLEFETGNISSAHRSMNKLLLGLKRNEIDLAVILMPVYELSYFLTDRVSNYEELEPYFEITEGKPFIYIGFNADSFDSSVPLIPKGKDGMSKRSIKKWKDRIENK
ncbi:restriction endonuclease [Bacillus haynesii]|uniref:restriction endonuclease n=1 Tax=Bacillus haynesii TaxID=1925021 RepID=UPI00227E06C8|nr:restriction endonuclease [Bacillus haynesii]MCY8575163.1 restriction endonuclease [Bacillus haynesii]MCY8712243.1 restriction endonuclease [Bacillus haynesii]MCY8739801.1 restriction endonuclease [Bacillus haynesii]MCY9149047.1 restriction endonuclease [Bacillus haynesii]MCY9318773.1 restriction endonuclease [Bacillus haynesii]